MFATTSGLKLDDTGIWLFLLSSSDLAWLLSLSLLPINRSDRVPRSGDEDFGAEVTVGSL